MYINVIQEYGEFQLMYLFNILLISIILDAKHKKVFGNTQDFFFLFTSKIKFLPTVAGKFKK